MARRRPAGVCDDWDPPASDRERMFSPIASTPCSSGTEEAAHRKARLFVVPYIQTTRGLLGERERRVK